MARPDPATTAQRLFDAFLAPLVLGGNVTPGPAIGPRLALSLGGAEVALDPSRRTEVEIARVRVARRVVAIDVVDPPSREEWALAGALHDLVHALHPGLDTVFRRSAPGKLVDGVQALLERIKPPASLAEVVSRHTLFARMLELRRTDTKVSWWIGSQSFLGTAPPPRLLAWPGVRQVHTEETSYTLTDLPETSHGPRRERLLTELRRFLGRVPLTDLATASRTAPLFEWSGATLGLLATQGGAALGRRALELGPEADVDAALGRATRHAVKGEAWETARRAARVLGDRELTRALTPPDPDRTLSPDATYARTLGAIEAAARLPVLALPVDEGRQAYARLEPYLRSPLGRELEPLLSHFLATAADLENAAGSVGGSSISIVP